MRARLGAIALLVRDYDEALAFFVDTLGFELREDTAIGAKRWVRVAPPGSEAELLLARASGPEQEARIGDQAGGRVFLFLHTDDFDRDYALWRSRGVVFEEPPPRDETYGRVAVFRDLYGNRWDLIGPAGSPA